MVPFLFSSPGQYSRAGIKKGTTAGRRNTKTKRHGDADAQRHRNIENKDAETLRHEDAEAHSDTETQ